MARKAAALKEAPPTEATEWLNFAHPCRGVNRASESGDGRVELLYPDGSGPRKKIALIGFATSSRHMAPLDDPDWAIVGMNQLQRHLRHLLPGPDGEPLMGQDGKTPISSLRHGDLWFEIHKEYNDAVIPGTDHEQWLKDCDMPVYMTHEFPGIDNAVAFPIDRLMEKFDIDYFTSTVAYMFAWAIDHIDGMVEQRLEGKRCGGPTLSVLDKVRKMYAEHTVGIFGIDLVVGEEYTDQRPCAEYWLGQAMARNISLVIPESSALLTQHYRYGYEMEPEGLLRRSDFSKRRATLQNEHENASKKAIEFYGRTEELKLTPVSEQYEAQRKARLEELRKEHQGASEAAVNLHGALQECEYWSGVMELRERGAEVN